MFPHNQLGMSKQPLPISLSIYLHLGKYHSHSNIPSPTRMFIPVLQDTVHSTGQTQLHPTDHRPPPTWRQVHRKAQHNTDKFISNEKPRWSVFKPYLLRTEWCGLIVGYNPPKITTHSKNPEDNDQANEHQNRNQYLFNSVQRNPTNGINIKEHEQELNHQPLPIPLYPW